MNVLYDTPGSRRNFPAIVLGVVVLALLAALPRPLTAAVLTHRYPFDTNANDVVSGANGALQGNAFITNGAVVFDGTNSGVRLPNNLFTGYSSVSFELWFDDEASTNMQEFVYAFGSQIGYMYYRALGEGGYFQGNDQTVLIALPTVGRTNHLVWCQDSNSQTACLYLNGLLAGQNTNFTKTPTSIGSTTNNWLGAYSAGTFSFKGSILEFRIYQGTLSALEVAQLDAAGPDQPQLNPGSLQNVRILLPATFGPGAALPPVVFANYANLSNVTILGQPELALTSDNTNVAVISTNLKVLTLSQGNANITASYLGYSNTVNLTVATPQGISLAHRYSFNEPPGTGVVHDSTAGANGRVAIYDPLGRVSPGLTGFDSGGDLNLSGGVNNYVALPSGLVSGQSEITVEAWLAWRGTTSWQRIFDFGSSLGQTVGETYLYLTPGGTTNSSQPPVVHAAFTTNEYPNESLKLSWTNSLPTNVPSHVAIAYSYPRQAAILYVNGLPVASAPARSPLSGVNDTNNCLGMSKFQGDPYFAGLLSEFRIYSGYLQDSDIAADYAAGPDVIGTDFVLRSLPTGSNLTLSWGPAMSNWVLQTSLTLDTTANWTAVNTTTNFQNNRYSVSLPMSDASGFFRLQQAP